MLFSIVHNPLTSASELNQDLKVISTWAYQWKMSFNPDPSKQATEILFTKKRNIVHHPPLFFNGAQVQRTDEHKHLGLILDPKLTFKNHIAAKTKFSRKNIGILKQLSLYIPLKTLDQLYKILVRPHLDYCDIIYHLPPNLNEFDSSLSLNVSMEMIEKVQYQAAMAITGTWQGTNRNKLYEELGWESLSERRWSRRLFQFFKIQNGLPPCYLTECIPRLRRPLYQNTILNTYHEFRCRTNLFKYSFFPSTVSSWNNLDPVIRSCLSIGSFKQHLIPLIRPKCS